MFSLHTHAQTVNLRIALATTKKGASTTVEYFSKMRNYADKMSAAGLALGDEEFVAYVLTGLDEELYSSLVSSIVTRVEPVSPSELFSQMISYELRLDKQSGGGGYSSSVNAATRGRGAPGTVLGLIVPVAVMDDLAVVAVGSLLDPLVVVR
jgi:hypothetical protein